MISKILVCLSVLIFYSGNYDPLIDQSRNNVVSSTIKFTIKNAGLTVTGDMNLKSADINFNPLKPEESRIHALADPATIKTGIKMRDNHLKKDDYFDVEQFDLIEMTTVKVIRKSGNNFEGEFLLKLKGNERKITVPFVYTVNDENKKLAGEFSINRLDYNIGGKSFLLSNTVNVSLEVVYN